ncbi:MAG: sialidase family protein, partial [Bacteroidota bacterium]|nr:sialidase family protein [Bacteroidota bacterium]
LDSTDSHHASTGADKYFLAVDNVPGSPYKDRVYETWVEYDIARKNRVRLSYSTDGGSTWSAPSYLTPSGNYQCPIPAVGPGGVLYLTYENIDPAIREIHCMISNDGGNTFPTALDKKIANYNDLGPLLPAGDPFAHPTLKGGLRVNSFPSIAIDNSAAHHGRIYVAWAAMGADLRNHIFLSTSDNSGNSWSTPRVIENDFAPAKTDKFFPWIATDDVTGDVGVAYYDSRTDTTNVLTDLFMLFSNDGGQNFSAERISAASSDVRAVSLIDTTGPNGPRYFFGDYVGLAAHNKVWHPAWTDSRVGYDQDIYTASVRPHAPAAPRNFLATEDTITHLPRLAWEHSGLTTFDADFGDYVFRLQRTDGGLLVDLPKTARSYYDSLAAINTDYTYTLHVVAANTDSSLTDTAIFSPRSVNEPLAPVITSAKAQPNGLEMFFRVPDKNIAGSSIRNLYKIYILTNGIVSDSFLVSDVSRGKVLSYRFYSLTPDGYYRIQLAASTRRGENDTILSALSPAKWLYAGTPLTTYSENFSGSKNIFTPFAWDTTNAGGLRQSEFINDSLANVPYQAGLDTWFLLPPVTISLDAKTLEFAHMALVASGDSATVEVSTNDGVDYFPIAQYDMTSHPADWTSSLGASRAVHEVLGLKFLLGQDVITRFRLRTHSSAGDGWFIDSIQFTNTLAVSAANQISSFRAELTSNPIRKGSNASLKLYLDQPSNLTITLYSMLGKKEEVLLGNKSFAPGEYELQFSSDLAGCYFFEAIAHSVHGEERRYGKFIVLP